jgi:hypothetical protein
MCAPSSMAGHFVMCAPSSMAGHLATPKQYGRPLGNVYTNQYGRPLGNVCTNQYGRPLGNVPSLYGLPVGNIYLRCDRACFLRIPIMRSLVEDVRSIVTGRVFLSEIYLVFALRYIYRHVVWLHLPGNCRTALWLTSTSESLIRRIVWFGIIKLPESVTESDTSLQYYILVTQESYGRC